MAGGIFPPDFVKDQAWVPAFLLADYFVNLKEILFFVYPHFLFLFLEST